MSDPKQIEQDLRDYLEKEPNLTKQDKLLYLQTIFHKHLELDKLEHLITGNDLFTLLSEASTRFVNTTLPLKVGRMNLDYNESIKVVLLESFIMYLNRAQSLKKMVKFDYRK